MLPRDGEEKLEVEEYIDSRGIPGWDRVEKLARALINLRGLSVSSTQAAEIKELYSNLLEFDKKPLVFKARLLSSPRGRFGRSKGKSHVGVDHVKRYV